MRAIDGGLAAPRAVLDRAVVTKTLLGRLNVILAQFPGATELVFNRPGEVLVEVGSTWTKFVDESLTIDWVHGLATAAARYSEQQINTSAPIMSAPLPGGERMQFVLPPAVEPGCASLTLRLPSHGIRSLEAYNADGYFSRFAWGFNDTEYLRRRDELDQVDVELVESLRSRDLVKFLESAVRAKKNIAVIGDTGSGKTTLMKTLCQSIPGYERLITIEDVRELFLPMHDNRVHLLYSKGSQGQAPITPADLIGSCMRMRPDRALLAELRGSEAFDYLKLLTTGHAGSITSFHARSCALAYERYIFMAREHLQAASYSTAELHRTLALTIDVIVHVVAVPLNDGSAEPPKDRYIKQIHFNPLASLEEGIGHGATMHTERNAA